MRNLIFLFIKHGGLVTFLFMEVLCMYLVVNNNQSQKEIYFSSSSAISDAIMARFDNVAQYIRLSEVNDSLVRENARLLAASNNAQFLKTIMRDSVKDVEKEQLYTYQTAKIISNSINRNNNSLTIDRGSKQKLKRSMGVIGADQSGVVGIIKSVNGNYSRVMSILHRQTSISSAIKRNGHYGSIVWRGNDPRRVNLIDVPKHADVQKNDTIQTSGYSTLFPPGVMIGTVDTFWKPPGSNFYEISVRLSMDMNRVKYVYVVENLHEKDMQEFQKEDSDE